MNKSFWRRCCAGILGAAAVGVLAGFTARPAGGEEALSPSGGEAGGQSAATQQEQPPQLRPWIEYPVIAHALGTVDGRRETNSKDAFLASYAAGQRVFETDLQLTSDGALVARHDWDQMSYYNLEQKYVGVMNHQTFLDTPICFYYTPLDFDGLLELLAQHPDAWLVTDSKQTSQEAVRAQLRAMTAAVERAGDPSLWNRIIVQIYHQEMYDWVREETGVTNFIFTLYQIENPDYEQIGAFCQQRGIPAVTMNTSRLTVEHRDILRSYGCKIYVHTVNRLRDMLEMSWGADGFYSDYVTPEELREVLAGTNQPHLKEEQAVLPAGEERKEHEV